MIKPIKRLWCWIVGHDPQTAGDYSMCWRCGQIKRVTLGAKMSGGDSRPFMSNKKKFTFGYRGHPAPLWLYAFDKSDLLRQIAEIGMQEPDWIDGE